MSSIQSQPDPKLFSSFDVSDQVFYESEHSFGIVNLKPIVNGHVLIIPKRNSIKRLNQLNEIELIDLFKSVQIVSNKLESIYGCNSLTISIQDGLDAGQSVPHLHVHILPRKPNDFKPNDEIYDHLNKFQANPNVFNGQVDNEERKPRSQEEMKSEANHLSKFFTN
ncbi:diadenosine tetraphosphate hydrolase [Melampsora americana]|nr:diadenosine tetraphosphate hydrolase [Melampsora americana]